MIVCTNCGSENEFGRVFCMNCGGKLDLGNMNKESIDELKGGWFAQHWKKVAYVAGGVVLLILLLGLWPNKAVLGVQGGRAEAMWVRSNLKRVDRIKPGMFLVIYMTEKRFNGYFAGGRAGDLGLSSVSGKLEEDTFSINAFKQFFSFRIKGYGLDVGLSSSVKWGVKDGVVKAKSGAIGHIPFPGPLAKVPASVMRLLIKDGEERKAVDLVKKAEIKNSQLLLRLEK